MNVLWIAIAGILFVGCTLQPILNEEDLEKYCAKPGTCEAYLRAKMLQYQNVGPVVVGVPSPPVPLTRDEKN